MNNEEISTAILEIFSNQNKLKNLSKSERVILADSIKNIIFYNKTWKELYFKEKSRSRHYVLGTIPLLQKELRRKNNEIAKYKHPQ